MSVTKEQITDLRERTGAGVVDCKKALQETSGDIEEAVRILRQKGLAAAAKKSGKVAAEGAVQAALNPDGTRGVLLELNCQTDFVAKNQRFRELLEEVKSLALESSARSAEELLEVKVSSGETLRDHLSLYVAEIGEKIELRRCQAFQAGAGQTLAEYTHPIGSKVAVMVKLAGESAQLGREIAMHVAAASPQPEFLSKEDIPDEAIQREKELEAGKPDLQGKPPEIVDKIITGRVNKYLVERVLLEQPSIKNPDKTISQLLSDEGCQLLEFAYYNLGEGIDKQEEDFAAEVQAQIDKQQS